MLQPLLTTLVEQNPEDMGDLYLDVAEAFLDIGEYGSALPLLSALVCSERYSLAVVWLRHAGDALPWGPWAAAGTCCAKVVTVRVPLSQCMDVWLQGRFGDKKSVSLNCHTISPPAGLGTG